MKLDPLFTVKNHELYKLADDSKINPSDLTNFEVNWSTVELEDEIYNEEFLADLRDKLKVLDESGKFAIITMKADKPLTSPEQLELFTNAFNHTARRIKDCVSVTGMAFPAELTAMGESAVESFIETLSKKHAQYVYFTSDKNIQNSSVVHY